MPGTRPTRDRWGATTRAWYDGRAEIIPFRYLPVLRGGMSHLGWGMGDLPSQGKKLRVSNPTRPRYPPRTTSSVVAPVAHQCTLHTPSGRHVAKAGAWHHFRRVRRVVAPVAPQCSLHALLVVIQRPGRLSSSRSRPQCWRRRRRRRWWRCIHIFIE